MKKILIVEDHADIRRLVRMTLEFEQYEVYEATNGEEGLAMAREVRPAIALLDVMMPGAMDGLALCRTLKSDPAFAGMPVVMLTARGHSDDREAGRLAGCDEYLLKPFSPLELIGTVGRLLDGR